MGTLRQLAYLVAVSDCQNFRKAADSVNVSQPTLSQQMRVLEARLGVVLIERGPGPAQLTPIGREIERRARRILLEVKDLEELAARSRQGLSGTIRFGVTPTLGPYIMPGIVASLHRQFPEMRLYIREGIPDEQARELARGELDMLLSPMPISGSQLHVEPLFREPLQLVAPPEHPLARAHVVAKADLAGLEFLSLDRRHHAHRQMRDICSDLGAVLLQDYEGTSLDSLRQMCGSGLGFAMLPELYLRSEVGGEDVVRRISISDWQVYRSIAAVWREGSAYAESYQIIAAQIASQARAILGSTSN